MHAPTLDVMHWEKFWSPDSKPQINTFASLQIQDNKQGETQIKHGNNCKTVPQDDIFTIHPGPHLGLLESLP